MVSVRFSGTGCSFPVITVSAWINLEATGVEGSCFIFCVNGSLCIETEEIFSSPTVCKSPWEEALSVSIAPPPSPYLGWYLTVCSS